MINYSPFLQRLEQEESFAEWAESLPALIEKGLNEKRFGDLPRWKKSLAALPKLNADNVSLNDSAITLNTETDYDTDALKTALEGLHPWRKGPFQIFDTFIDTEWRSDWKWDRLIEHISPLEGKTVLDIGCGSGYHCWRMRGAGAELAIGVDPTPLFICQFFALQTYIQDPCISVLPMGIEHLPEKMHAFDTVFSMGILYHRRSPFDHLIALRDLLKPGGELVLETLVIEGNEGETLVPEGRYAKMGNVWFIPSPATLLSWLKKAGFKECKLVDVNQTSLEEQRSTDWMRFHSLEQFLDPENQNLTAEGHPAPRRAIIIASS